MVGKFNFKALVINLILVVSALVLAALTWWNSERLIPVQKGIDFPPGSKVIKEENSEDIRGEVINYNSENKASAADVQKFFVKQMSEKGWKVKSPKKNVKTFSRKGEFARLVVHKEKRKTRFTFNHKVFK